MRGTVAPPEPVRQPARTLYSVQGSRQTTTRPARRSAVLAVVLSLSTGVAATLVGCSSAPPTSSQPAPTGPAPSATASRTTPATVAPSTSASAGATGGTPARMGTPAVLASRLEVPWGMAFLPDGSALVAERPTGRVLRIAAAGGAPVRVGTVPGVQANGEGGLLGLAIAPKDPGTVFAYLTSTEGDNRVLKMPLTGGRLGAPTVVLSGIPAASTHDGGRIAVGPDGKLWIGTGDAQDRTASQDRANLAGKILRIGTDGSVPADNPFPGSPVWSYGHRNVQGLAFDSTGQLWATEFGQNTWDELNRVVKGGNHGWPEVEGREGRAGFVDPQVVWSPADASPSGLAIVDDVAYVASLRGRRLWQVPLTGTRAGTPVAALQGAYGRLRTVEPAPDGALWLSTSNSDRESAAPDDDRIVRVPLG